MPPGFFKQPLPLLALAVLLAYANALGTDFQFDDYKVIVDNPNVHGLAAWFASQPGIRPLLRLADTLNWVVCNHPACFVTLNIVIHAACVVAVFKLSEKLCRRYALHPQAALLAALLFAIHPVHTEAVTYISGRSMGLMTCFYLWSVVYYERWREAGQEGWRWISLLLFILALLVRETAITLPLALWLWERQMRPGQSLKLAFMLTGRHWLLLALPSLMLLIPRYQAMLANGLSVHQQADMLPRQAGALFYLVSKAFMPLQLCIDPLPIKYGLLKLALLAGLLLWLRQLKRFSLPIGFAILWLGLHLLPSNSIFVRHDFASERHLYAATWPMLLVLSGWILSLRARLAMVAVLLPVLMSLTWQRNTEYRDEVSLWQSTVAVVPENARAWNNLGYALEQTGRRDEAREAYRQALRINPDFTKARQNLYAVE